MTAAPRSRPPPIDPTGGAAPRPAGGAVGVPTPRARASPIDLAALRHGLVAADTGAFAAPPWLAEAAVDPGAFWRGVAPALVAAVAGTSRTTLFERYQLAHELGARHATGRAAGFVVDDPAAGAITTSYSQLVEAARLVAAAWCARGVGPGSCVAIVAPLQPELACALLAAWQLGAIAAPLPVWGRTYVLDRLAALRAEFVATSRARALWLDLPTALHLPIHAALDAGTPGLAYSYAPDEPALRVFSPLGDAPLLPIDVPAERLYLGALRDAVLFFDLAAGAAVAAPGCCEVQVGIPLLVTCLAAGAHLVAVELPAACQRPDRVCDGRVHLLGVDPALRDAIVARGAAGAGPARWFRSAATAHEPEAWAQLARARPFARALGACYVPSPVAGGAITWSAWRRSPALNTAIPAPGLDWQLRDPGRGGAVASDGNGVLTSSATPPEAIGQPLLGRLAGDSLWVTSIAAHAAGQRVPSPEIEALVAARAEVACAAVIDDPRDGAVLVVFARPDRIAAGQPARDALAGELAALIAVELAPRLVPARIEVFTLAPRTGPDGAIDRAWCRGQHVGGRLAAKQREPMFTALAELQLTIDDDGPR